MSRWAKTGESKEKPPGTPASRTWLISHVACAAVSRIEALPGGTRSPSIFPRHRWAGAVRHV